MKATVPGIDDAHRPQYHFLPTANWMNDPNGVIQWRGRYHLFYQHNPNGAFWGTMHWGHAVSDDLVHWTHLPIALAPTPGGPDWDGCFSGCAVDDLGLPRVLYTGVHPQVQCLATGSDDLCRWKKHPANPVIAGPPADLDVLGFRDPCVWQEGEMWYALIGSGIRDVGGTALLYRSPDLVEWQYMHPLCIGDKAETGEMWECPDLFPVRDRHVLLVSPIPLRKALYFVGSYAGHRFEPSFCAPLDAGGYFYAPQTLIDDRGRRLMWGWIWEGRDEEAQVEAGWAGVMSLPRWLTLRDDGVLGMVPVPELRMLRGAHFQQNDRPLMPRDPYTLPVKGDCLEIEAAFGAGAAGRFGLRVRRSPGGEEETAIVYDAGSGHLVVDRTRSSRAEVQTDPYVGQLDLAPGEGLSLHLFLDRSVIEIYANQRLCMTSRIYPSRSDSLDIQVFSEEEEVCLLWIDVWQMRSIWGE